MGEDNDTADGAAAGTVSTRIVLLSILGVWGVYFLLVTSRAALVDPNWAGDALWKRALVSLFSAAVTLPLWLALQQMARRSVARRVAAMMLLSLPAAAAAGWFNYRVFSTTENWFLTDGRTRIIKDAGGNMVIETPGAAPLVIGVGHPPPGVSAVREVSDIALGRYFLLVAWGALFLAMSQTEDVRAAERRSAAFRRAAKAAELRSLRYQVNPHFLFNTLNSLSALVMTGRQDKAEAMIQTLSRFYRASLTSDPTADLPLEEEIRLQELYLRIEEVRFPERLRTAVRVDPAARGACVPGMILQPLVENAIKHGVARSRQAVTIAIEADIEGGRLVLTVSDDAEGRGAPAETAGIGLVNVRERLLARFGADATARAGATTRGWRVRLEMPVVRGGC